MKGIVDALEAIAQLVNECDPCNQILDGLGPEYNSIQTSIGNPDSPISFEELFGQLLTFEIRLELHHSTSAATAPYTSPSSRRSGSRRQTNYRGHGQGRNSKLLGGSSTQSTSH